MSQVTTASFHFHEKLEYNSLKRLPIACTALTSTMILGFNEG
ncbi:MAG: hypothetical protein OJF50_003567 [Nitrospira sp.]|nr:hypothetical protein [Nitrospira sp.]